MSGFVHLRLIISLISNKRFFDKFLWLHFCALKSHREGGFRAWNSVSGPGKGDSLVQSSVLQPGVILPQETFGKTEIFIVPNWKALLASSG